MAQKKNGALWHHAGSPWRSCAVEGNMSCELLKSGANSRNGALVYARLNATEFEAVCPIRLQYILEINIANILFYF